MMSNSGFEPPRPGEPHPPVGPGAGAAMGGSTPVGGDGQSGWWGPGGSPQSSGQNGFGQQGHPEPPVAATQQYPAAPPTYGSPQQYPESSYGAGPGYGQTPDPSYPYGAGPYAEGQQAPRPSKPISRRGVLAACLGSALVASTLVGGGMALLDDDSGTSDAAIQSRPDGAVDWAAVAKQTSASVVSIGVRGATESGTGSGSVMDKDGHILTNAHVADVAGQSGKITVLLNDGRVYPNAKFIGSDKSSDVAVIQITNPPSDLAPMRYGNSDDVRPGQPVMAIGSPLELDDTITTGIVSAINRPVVNGQEEAKSASDLTITNAIQTDAAINPGNSGGALINSSGEMIGIPSSIRAASGQGGSIGLGFAIPIKEGNRIAKELIQSGSASHAWLGVELNNGAGTSDGTTHMGAKVTQVTAGSPAASAGLAAGDVVIKIDDTPTTSADGLSAQIRLRSPGTEVRLTVIRGGAAKEFETTLGRKSG